MVLDMREYANKLKDRCINISYSGPMWDDGIKGIAEMVKSSLSHDDLSAKASKMIFSVFVEQITNMLMYSAEKEQFKNHENEEVSVGMLVLGHKENVYFIQTGNVIKPNNMELIKNRINHLNTLDKQELRQYYKEVMRSGDDNPESLGAGLGLIEIARRATAPIGYRFEPQDDGLVYFTMYVEIAREET